MPMQKKKVKLRKLGRPESRIIKLNATPEQAARAIFSAVKPPNPALRKTSPQVPLG